MIITVTMNPAIDKTADLAHFDHGGLNRLSGVIMDAGGKGINVSKTIHELGGETIATGFIGGSGGVLIEKALSELGIQSDFVFIKNEIRTNMKVVESNGLVTELNEPGPMIHKEEVNELTEKLVSYAKEDTLFIFAGSIPNGIDTSIYKTLIEKVKEKGAKVFLDADGELFINAIEAKPDIIKPNRHEIEKFFKMDYRADEKELLDMGNRLLDKGIHMVTISLGQMGALFLTKEQKLKCPGLKVEAHSTVGAGDAMVAALAYGLDQGLDLEECVKLSMAASAGAVTTKGTKPPKRELVDELMEKVIVIQCK
ncbi:1-phosphofructokinase [Anaerocolumna aminovalerica]|uniref:Tagatose-6-phosphate kinase n=1 Tax=Anaerocolumna aminovalerica TaxID=1527 RepID=A0A1I5CF60_9FIRM|nr:1-phosphofructokinase [Anaerocolumna aminovalerica]MBU5333344.1 1-phosphofructokinase [Anaerocolumna aminovalerica]SFN85452.1 fructose-1-phosphate kinase [Anaerocolumna aminovalerica]